MIKAACTIVICGTWLAAPVVVAQSHPNFAGTWVEDEAARKSNLPAPPGGAKSAVLPPVDLVVRQTGADVVLERTFMGHVVGYTYHLDGRESVNHNGANTQTTRSAWDGAKLVTQGTSFSVTSAGESLWQFKETRWIDASGAMVTETTHTDEAGKVTAVTQVYRKKPVTRGAGREWDRFGSPAARESGPRAPTRR